MDDELNRKVNVRGLFNHITPIYYKASETSGDAEGFKAFFTALAVFRNDNDPESPYIIERS
jgi:hypothetical protein